VVKAKTVVDVSNVFGPKVPATSVVNGLQTKLPGAKVVKSFNMVFAQNMETGHAANQQISLFMASDSEEAKKEVSQLGSDLGFDPIDIGPLDKATLLESLGSLIVQIGYTQGLGPNIGFKLVH